MSAPSHLATKTYTIGDAEDQIEVDEFTLSPADCSVTYETTVSPPAEFMTPLASGRGMSWSTSNEADAGTYTVSVTATSGAL